jgi:agrin
LIVDRCAGISCERRGQVCIDGLCMCRQTPCPAIYNPVCGSDSVTYPNQCKLDEVACTDNRDIDTLHEGGCIDDGFGSGGIHGAVAVLKLLSQN